MTDVNNCGALGYVCQKPGGLLPGPATCEQGVCKATCKVSFLELAGENPTWQCLNLKSGVNSCGAMDNVCQAKADDVDAALSTYTCANYEW
jgi:hypothetical protein